MRLSLAMSVASSPMGAVAGQCIPAFWRTRCRLGARSKGMEEGTGQRGKELEGGEMEGKVGSGGREAGSRERLAERQREVEVPLGFGV